MSVRIARNLKNFTGIFEMRRFSSVETGEKEYNLRSFAEDEELSVQDIHFATGEVEPETIEPKGDEITDNDYLPPSKLAKAKDGPVGEAVKMPEAAPGRNDFVESDIFFDVEEHQEDYPRKVVKPSDQGLSPQEAAQAEEFAALRERAQAFEEKVSLVEAEKENVLKSLAQKEEELEALKSEMEALKNSLPEKLAAAKEEGRKEGHEAGAAESKNQYEAQREDYLAKMESFNKEALKKLDEISEVIKSVDDQLTETVIGFVRSIIGTERRLNDGFVANLIKQNLTRLNELKEVSFTVNPADGDIVKKELPGYSVKTDPSVEKGSVAVSSKVGQVELSAEAMINDLEKQINEELAATKNPET